MFANGKLRATVEDLSAATNGLAESVTELREQVRRQQFRINELENAVSESRSASSEALAAAPQTGVSGQIADISALNQLKKALLELQRDMQVMFTNMEGIAARLDEHEQGMRWLYQNSSTPEKAE